MKWESWLYLPPKIFSIASEAHKKRVEVVGTTWVIESIVCGEVAALASFRVDCKGWRTFKKKYLKARLCLTCSFLCLTVALIFKLKHDGSFNPTTFLRNCGVNLASWRAAFLSWCKSIGKWWMMIVFNQVWGLMRISGFMKFFQFIPPFVHDWRCLHACFPLF